MNTRYVSTITYRLTFCFLSVGCLAAIISCCITLPLYIFIELHWGDFSAPRFFWVPMPRWMLTILLVTNISGMILLGVSLALLTWQNPKRTDISVGLKHLFRFNCCVLFLLMISSALFTSGIDEAFLAKGQTTLSGVAMVSPTEGWAVGAFDQYNDGGSFRNYGIIWHYSQGKWTQTVQLAQAFHYLNDVAVLANGEAWAVGAQDTILHEQGEHWTLVQSDTSLDADDLSKVTMVSPTEGWAVGHSFRPHGSVWHYSQRRWSQVFQLAHGLSDIGVLPNGEAWVVGWGGIILHEKDGKWRNVLSPTRQNLNSIKMISPTEGWAAGDSGTLLHYYNGKWSLLPASHNLNSIEMTSPTEGWAVGSEGNILHYTQNSWNPFRTAPGQVLESIAMVPGSMVEGWIVGRGLVSDTNAALVPTFLHLQHGKWIVYNH